METQDDPDGSLFARIRERIAGLAEEERNRRDELMGLEREVGSTVLEADNYHGGSTVMDVWRLRRREIVLVVVQLRPQLLIDALHALSSALAGYGVLDIDFSGQMRRLGISACSSRSAVTRPPDGGGNGENEWWHGGFEHDDAAWRGKDMPARRSGPCLRDAFGC